MAKTAAERQRDKRKRDKDVTESVTNVDVTPIAHVTSLPVGLEHYHGNPAKYVKRVCPELLNWGLWMNSTQLEQAGLKANRVAIPGDWDYEGAAIFIPGLPLTTHSPQEATA